jgi:hypothetical protein
MGDPPSRPDDAVAGLQGEDGQAVARGVMDDNTKHVQQLREAVQQLHNAEGQPGEELVRDIARVIAAANAMLNGTSWDASAKAAYADWQAVEATGAEQGSLVAAAEEVRGAGEAMLAAAGTQATEDPTTKLQEWSEGTQHLDAVVERATEACARLGGGGRPPSS